MSLKPQITKVVGIESCESNEFVFEQVQFGVAMRREHLSTSVHVKDVSGTIGTATKPRPVERWK